MYIGRYQEFTKEISAFGSRISKPKFVSSTIDIIREVTRHRPQDHRNDRTIEAVKTVPLCKVSTGRFTSLNRPNRLRLYSAIDIQFHRNIVAFGNIMFKITLSIIADLKSVDSLRRAIAILPVCVQLSGRG